MELNEGQRAILRYLKQCARRHEAAERAKDAPPNARIETWRAYDKLNDYVEELKAQGFHV